MLEIIIVWDLPITFVVIEEEVGDILGCEIPFVEPPHQVDAIETCDDDATDDADKALPDCRLEDLQIAFSHPLSEVVAGTHTSQTVSQPLLSSGSEVIVDPHIDQQTQGEQQK